MKEDAWLDFKKNNTPILDKALGPQVSATLTKIRESGILNRLGAGAPSAIQNVETLLEAFTRKAFDAGYKAREDEALTKVIGGDE